MLGFGDKTGARIDGLHEELSRLRDRLEVMERQAADQDARITELEEMVERQSWAIGRVQYIAGKAAQKNYRQNKRRAG